MKVHPDADIFPMMPDDELAALADDIKANGLIHPIVTGLLDNEEVLIDGRNRLKACEIAGVKPTYKKLNGENQKAFILSVNVSRRHLTSGQRVMAVAMVYPEREHGGRGQIGKLSGKTESLGMKAGQFRNLLSDARTILTDAPDLARLVVAGTMPISAAFKETCDRSGTAKNRDVRLRRLREQRPDLADRVVQNEISIETAEAQAKAEAEARKQPRWAATVNLIDGVKLLDRDAETAAEIAADFDPSIAEQRGETFSPARLRRAAAFLATLADIMEKCNA
jgi:hypothetical protein